MMVTASLPTSLLDLLCNTVVLFQLTPYLPITSLLALKSTSKSYRHVLQSAPETHRYLDLSKCKAAVIPDMSVDHGGVNWRHERMDESLTEDDIYSGPLRGIFSILSRSHALQHVQTMILDGLTVPADLAQEVISSTNVRILSLRRAKQLNQVKLMQVLKYAVRPSRPAGTPKLRGLYLFGHTDCLDSSDDDYSKGVVHPLRDNRKQFGVTVGNGAQIGATRDDDEVAVYRADWYQSAGRMAFTSPIMSELWAETLIACEGIISFDAVLCRGPRHDVTSMCSEEGQWLKPTLATHALGPSGCAECKSSIEGPAIYGQSPPSQLPLLSPPPLHSSHVSDAQRPASRIDGRFPQLVVRCEQCLVDRWCERCIKWWCERCYPDRSKDRRTSEVRLAAMALDPAEESSNKDIRVLLGLCTGSCLVSEEMYASGSGGMWG